MIQLPSPDDQAREAERIAAAAARIRIIWSEAVAEEQAAVRARRYYAATAVAAASSSVLKAARCAAQGEYAADESATAALRTRLAARLIAESARSAGNDTDAAIAEAVAAQVYTVVEESNVADALDVTADMLAVIAPIFNRLQPVRHPNGTSRPPSRMVRALVGAGAALLPPVHRARYGEEWLSLFAELPTRRARIRHLWSVLAGAPRLSYALRRPLPQHRRRA
ncbi:hypothetical protein [Actinomadura violacea]|uniref:Uncharacterized protein n=1 Tax=Actinomadura violacea TaxID=2819934 RepID=A0ABS3RWL7_9ACTN|nr:hypothetical protein [Actinomadura violacea]MBO2461145.1 hypothetical protein [Actinomadura violacea]